MNPNDPPTLSLEEPEPGLLVLRLSGRLDAEGVGRLWEPASHEVRRRAPRRLRVEASGIAYCDGAGEALLLHLRRIQLERGAQAEIEGLDPGMAGLLAGFDPALFPTRPAADEAPAGAVEDVGRTALGLWREVRALVSFVGELTAAFAWALRRPGSVRWRDALLTAELAGANALPIVGLVGFLMGLIMAFQAALQMKQYGAEIYVADLITLSMLKELGAVMTAIVLAGRSGSAFAAELGTMKVKEEIDALTTMALDPVRFLVLPRVMAAVFVTPLLTVFANLAGLFGGAVVMLTLRFPLVTFINRALDAGDLTSLGLGFFKAAVFGLLVGGIGCFQGLKTGQGASAVGDSTTRAVVGSIILITVADGIFSVLFFSLGV